MDRRTDRASLLATWRAVLRARWRTGITVFTVVLALVAAILFLTHPIHRADARLRLGEPPPMSGVSPTSGFFGLLRLGGDPFANDLELIDSRTLNEQIVEDVALNATVAASRGWYRDSLFTRLTADRTTDKATFAVRWADDGRIHVRQTSPTDSVIGTAKAGEPFAFGGLVVAFRPWRQRMPREISISTLPFDDAARLTRERMQVERTRREANVVDIAYDSPDPQVAQAVVVSAVRGFIALRTKIQQRESGETVDSLRAVAAGTLAELRAAEHALEAIQRETRLVAPEAQNEVFVEHYAAVLADLERAKREYAAIDSVLGRAEAADRASAWTTLLAYPRFLENENVGSLLTQITTLEQQRRDMASRRAEENREYRVLVDQIGYLDGTLRTLAVGYRTALAQQIVALERQVADMDRTLAAVPGQALELARRQRDVRLLTEVVVLTEQRLRQEELRQALTFANVQVVDPPALRRKPVWPRRKLGLAVGFVLASMTGALGMAVAETADRTVRRSSQAVRLVGAPVLGVARVFRRDFDLPAADIAAVRTRAGRRFAVAAVDASPAAVEVARVLSSGDERAEALPDVVAVDPIDRFATAAQAAAVGPVVLVLAAGSTQVDAVERARSLLEEAGASIAGTVLVVSGRRVPADVWT